jgi:hypothetical protein
LHDEERQKRRIQLGTFKRMRSFWVLALLASLSSACGAEVEGGEEAITTTSEGLTTCGSWPQATTPDDDGDGIVDGCERYLAERFAPIVYHSSDESNYPANVDWFLPKTTLYFYDDDCWPDLNQTVEASPPQWDLPAWSYSGGCGASDTVFSGGTRSDRKHRTFYLADVASQHRVGSSNTQDWVTYVHAYRNTNAGITLQYWRFYAYNDAGNDHGGDWEGIHVVLDGWNSPTSVVLLGHESIERHPPSNLTWEGTHVRVFSEGGGHATAASGSEIKARCRTCFAFFGCIWTNTCTINPSNPDTFVRQETYPGGRVSGYTRPDTLSGPLINVGEKLRPLNGQSFIRYSGIWGSPGAHYGFSGYWGPAYNETEMGAGYFSTAWCEGMANPPAGECTPGGVSR